MHHYDHEKGWWVELEGAADLPMCELDKITEGVTIGWPVLEKLLKDSFFTDEDGEKFQMNAETIGKGKQSLRQWFWAGKQALACALDEIASPEA